MCPPGVADEDEAIIFAKDNILEVAAQKGFASSLKANSPLEKRFKRWIGQHSDEMQKYEGMDREQKRARRLAWITDIYDHYIEERKKAEVEKRFFKVKGRWLNLDAIIACEGGHHSAEVVEGAVNIAKHCIMMGKGWARLNVRSKRLEFRYVEESEEHEHGTEWTKTEKESKDPVSRTGGKGVGSSTARSPITPVVTRAQPASATPTPVNAPADAKGTGPSAHGLQTSLAKKVAGRPVAKGKAIARTGSQPKAKSKKKSAQKDPQELTPMETVDELVGSYGEAHIKAQRLLAKILGPKADPDWGWAAPVMVHQPLLSAIKEMDAAVDGNGFFGQVLLTSMQACQSTMEEATFKAEVAKTALHLPTVVDNVLQETSALCQMHACRSVRRASSFIGQ